ncbi:MAG: hypothetical protein OXE17_01530 [Chloroflexi bacterium]|nr:hypothetical protein [Chloroflexota bacterium]
MTLAPGAAAVSESAGPVTVTATLDAPAQPEGVSLALYPGSGSAADPGLPTPLLPRTDGVSFPPWRTSWSGSKEQKSRRSGRSCSWWRIP